MCENCWTEHYDSTLIINDKTLRAKDLIDKVYEYSLVGGSLHLVISDWNLDDDSISFVKQYAIDNKEDEEKFLAEMECIELLESMTEEERASALALRDGLTSIGG